ncbi:class I SAM-dependent DNA methyltransferase [Luteipulveratus sp. YIM 133132]|uniref:type I restriction-modification system subunit M n=1 Tax=Luteipulveratus flavus TaxID=3031728 RepID=UPI0023AFC928|nr:class I SAM-dependent DNA methyltransferase [Luteipulveratus sp. YIM 133132]MDE9367244.1 class I SAM-dependent DNA methyltransferase [Luteipulveratus sp. YIM 133132]
MLNHAQFIWNVADSLRGSYKSHEFGDVILPFTVLRRLDSVLEPTKAAVLEAARAYGGDVSAGMLRARAGHHYSFWNLSPYTLTTLAGDVDNLRDNLENYVEGFSGNVRDIFDRFKILEIINELDQHDLLLVVLQHFAAVDLRPAAVDNEKMGHIFEELIRKFAEASNETAGEHFTPRDVIELMVTILVDGDPELTNEGVIRSVYDPTAGTGGMLSVADDHLRAANLKATVNLVGQEINPQSYAVCKADMILKGQPIDSIRYGDTLVADAFANRTFHYCLSNPPFGVDWKKIQKQVQDEKEDRGWAGRFGAGLPRVSDGSLLFLMHLISKMHEPRQDQKAGRAAIVLNGSPLFTGGAGSGESNVRKWVLEQDWLEAIIALPTDMFYNTGIATYVWILNKDKPVQRKGKVQLINATGMFEKMRKSIGSKRNQVSAAQRDEIAAAYRAFEETKTSKIFATTDFFYRTITVERPLRLNFAVTDERIERALASKTLSKLGEGEQADLRKALDAVAAAHPGEVWTSKAPFQNILGPALSAVGVSLKPPQMKVLYAELAEADDTAEIVTGAKGNVEPSSNLRDTENVPWDEDIHEYLEREVKPFVADAWIDESKTKEGCEIPFTRHFYEYVPPRPLEEIDRDLEEVLGRIRTRLDQVKQ